MKDQNQKVGVRELTSIIIFIITLKSQNFNTMPLFQGGLTATWAYPLIWLVLFMMTFPLFSSVLSKFDNMGLFEVNQILLGKFIGSLVNILAIFILFITVLYGSKYYVNYLSLQVFPKTPIYILYILILFTSYYIAKGGLESIGRIAWIFLPFYLLVNLLLIVLVLKESFIVDVLFPLFGNGLGSSLWHAVKSSYIFGEFLALGYIVTSLKDYKTYKSSSFLGSILSALLMVFIFLSYLSALDYQAPQKILNIYNELIRSTEELTQFSVVYLSIWVSASIIRLSYFLFSLSFIIGKLLKVRDPIKLILPITGVIFIVGLIPQDPYSNVTILSTILGTYLWPIFIFLPILLWVLARWRRDKIENN